MRRQPKCRCGGRCNACLWREKERMEKERKQLWDVSTRSFTGTHLGYGQSTLSAAIDMAQDTLKRSRELRKLALLAMPVDSQPC